MKAPDTAMTPIEGATHRIGAAAEDVAARKLAVELSLQIRDAAIVEGVDLSGVSHRQAARAANVGRARIEAILAAGHPSTQRRRVVGVEELGESYPR